MSTKFEVNNVSISTLLGYVKDGTIAIPEIQRPFVWDSTKVRNLIDSLYKGYPVGYIITGIKSIKDTQVGDTITHVQNPTNTALEGYRPALSMVFAGIYPVSTDDYEDLREALEKLGKTKLARTEEFSVQEFIDFIKLLKR